MSKTVKIPDNMKPWEAIINGVKYVYEAGTEQEVPDEVAAFIERLESVKPEVQEPVPPFGSAGGGVTSWNDLTDKPFDSKVKIVEVVPEQSVTCRNEDEEPYGKDIGFMPEVGKKYRVFFNGDEYICDVREGEYVSSDDGGSAHWIGNASIRDGRLLPSENTGEPFLIDDHWEILQWSSDLGETITIQVIAESETIKTIDPKYVDALYVKIFSNAYGGYYCNKTYLEILDAIRNDVCVHAVFISKSGNGYISHAPYGNVTMYDDNTIGFIDGYNVDPVIMDSENCISYYSQE